MDDPPTFDWTPPKQRRGSTLALGMSAALLLGLCGVGVWFVDGGPGAQPPRTSPPAPVVAVASPSATPDDHTVELLGSNQPSLGTRIRHGALEYRVTEQRCGIPEVGVSAQPSRGHFCVVTLDVRNHGRTALVFTPADQIAYTTSGGRYLGSASATRHANGPSRTFLTPIAPGAGVTGKLAFDLPKGSRLDSVRLRSAVAIGSVSVRLT